MSENIQALSKRKGLSRNLFETLTGESQSPLEGKRAKELAREFLVGQATVVGAKSFYDFTNEAAEKTKIRLCSGTACLLAGTQDKLREKLEATYSSEQVGEICCLGRCHENNAFQFEGKNYSGRATDHLEEILSGKAAELREIYEQASNLDSPILMQAIEDLSNYYSVLTRFTCEPKAILEELKTSKLRGRGGAGFPAGVKWESCASSPGEEKYVVCNADEGDPGSYSDRYLLEERPHSVLFGMAAAGLAVGATTGVLYIRGEYPESIEAIEKAIRDYQALDLEINFTFKIIKGMGAYICGEETALLSSIEGQRPEVRVRPPYPTVSGLFGCPTIVNNVETFANLHFILTQSGSAFSTIGTRKSTGSKLVSLDSFFKKPGVYEVAMGTALKEVLYDLGGGFASEVKALQIGGPLGGLVPTPMANELTLDFESFAERGFLLGHASIVSIPASYPIIAYLRHLFEFTALESCGKCFPCRLGSVRGKELTEKAMGGQYQIDPQLMTDLLQALEQGSLCALGGGVPLPIKNALQYFSDELAPYFRGGKTHE